MFNATVALTIIQFFSKILGLLRELVLSYLYGTSAMSDAFVMATSFSTVIFMGMAATFLNAYMPVATRKKEKPLLIFTSRLLNFSTLFSLLLGFLLIIFIRPVLSIFAVGFTGKVLEDTILISIPAILASCFLCASMVLCGYLQTQEKFNGFGIQALCANSIVIVVLLIAVNNPLQMGIGYALSMIIPTALLYFLAYRRSFRYSPIIGMKNPDLTAAIRLAIPIFLGQIAAQLNVFIDHSFASMLAEGTVSAMKYASLLCVFAVSTFAVPISLVMYPKACTLFEQKNYEDMTTLVAGTLRKSLFILFPLGIGAAVLATPIIRLLFERGAFGAENTALTSTILSFYAASILGNTFSEIMNRAFFAIKDSKTPIICYVTGIGLNIILNALLIRVWQEKGLALATSLSSIFIAVTILLAYKRKNKQFSLRQIGNAIFCSSIAGGAMLLACLLINRFVISGLTLDKTLSAIVALAIPAVGSLLVYVVVLYALKVPEVYTALRQWRHNRSKL